MKHVLNEVCYFNSSIKVVYMYFGPFYRALFALFDIDTFDLSSCTVITARKRLSDAIREADFIHLLRLYGMTE